MHHGMSQRTRREVLARLWRSYARAGAEYKHQLLDQAVALLGYHRKAAIRALRAQPPPFDAPAVQRSRPRDYEPARLLPVLKPIWFAALQPCGSRLAALLPEWLPPTSRTTGGWIPNCGRACWPSARAHSTGCWPRCG